LLLTAKSNNDKYLYLSKIENTPRKLKELRKEFAVHTTNKLHTEYDRGYFAALESYVRKLERCDVLKEPQRESTEEAKRS